MKVLIVDDEIEICKRLKSELKKEGFRVEYTTSPVGVIEKIYNAKNEGEPYKLLLLDLLMPKVSGFELLKEIREAGLDLDVIIITAYGNEDKAIEAIHHGAIDYLRKPFSLEDFHAAVFRVQQKRAEKEEKALRHRILVVDDEKDLCERIKQELDKEGYEAAVAYNGIEGLEYFKNNHVDAVIADIRMPRMDGLEMLEKCRAINHDFVSIIITGFGNHEKAIKSLKLGVFDYLRKPISLEELITVVNKGVDLLALRKGLSARRRELEIETALKTQYAEKIEHEKRFTENIVATVPDSLLVLNPDLRIKSANRSFYETFQTEPEKMIGTRITDILGDKDGKLGTELTRLFGTEDMLENLELCYQSEKLGERIFNITARGIIFAEEAQQLVVLQDITKRKQAEEALRDSEEKYRSLVESTEDSICLLDRNCMYLFINEKHLSRLGLTADKAIGRKYSEFHSEDDTKEFTEKIKEVFETGKSLYYEHRSQKDGGYFLRTLSPVKEPDGRIVSITVVSKDITKRKQAEEKIQASLKEKEVLLKEIHHRVKNNLQVIASLLNLQSQHINDKESRAMFQESQDRVRSMALIHEKLYTSGDLSHIDIASYIHSLTHQLITTYSTASSRVSMNIAITDIFLTITTAIPCGLIINELVSNALKHAFPQEREGTIAVSMTPSTKDNLILTVSDTGIGFPEGIDFRNTTTLGMQLVTSLVEQLDGTITLDRSKGITFTITFRGGGSSIREGT